MVNLVNMPVSRERMQKYQNRHLRQLEHAAKQYEGREMKSKNNMMRKEWLERQTNANYRNEYDRIRGELSRNKIPYKSVLQLQHREKNLRRAEKYGGLRRAPQMEEIVNYLANRQEKANFPDREAKQIRNHPFMTQLDFLTPMRSRGELGRRRSERKR